MKIKVISEWSKTKYFGRLLIAYTIAHGGILCIPNAIYWDDWTLYKVDNQVILDVFRQAGSMLNIIGQMHVIFLSLGPWFYKLLTFLLMFGASIALDFILRRYKTIGIEARFLIILFFLILPFYWARVALIDMAYTVCYFLFFTAWALIDKFRLLSLVLFFISYNTNSLLVFYLLPFLDYYCRSVEGNLSIKSLLNFSLFKLDFFLLPFLFFSIKIFLFPPTGLYEGYNEHYSFKSLLLAPVFMVWEWVSQLTFLVVPFFILLLIFYYYFHTRFRLPNVELRGSELKWYLIGVFIFCLGGFPYWILGHIPTFSEWTSRHQLLLPLGSAFILTALIKTVGVEQRILFVSVLLSVFISLNIKTYKDFYVDWEKQKQLIQLFKNSDAIRNSQLIVFNDKTIRKNALKRIYRIYEWNGLMYLAFGDEKRLGLGIEEFELLKKDKLFSGYFLEGEKFRAGDFKYDASTQTVLVDIDFDNVSLKKRLLAFGRPFLSISSTFVETPYSVKK